jgi:hypothetical protein
MKLDMKEITDQLGKYPGLIFAFTTTQIHMIHTINALVETDDEEEREEIRQHLAETMTVQTSMLAKVLEIGHEDVTEAMSLASKYMRDTYEEEGKPH